MLLGAGGRREGGSRRRRRLAGPVALDAALPLKVSADKGPRLHAGRREGLRGFPCPPPAGSGGRPATRAVIVSARRGMWWPLAPLFRGMSS